ncbi:MAG: hypothetical protein ACXAC7_07855 [Candidatus Hodarchaeales archaeon]|jgi:phosphomannomutase/phosphoglucomutase
MSENRPKLRYFGTSGIRGRTLIDITPSMAERMARAYSDVVLSGITKPFVIIGRDTRYGAETIEMAIIAGLTASGISVIRCGIVPTPTLLTYQRYIRADGAIMITGSHIPPDRIGLIFLESDGAYCSDYMAFQIEQRFDEFNTSLDGLIQVNSVDDLLNIGWIKDVNNIWEVYTDYLEALVDLPVIQKESFHVIIDPANGTAAHFFSEFLGKLGLKVTAINDYPSPLSTRLSEPIDENLTRLKTLVKDGADLGIAFDVDADRVTFVVPTPNGQAKTLSANVTGTFILKELLDAGHRGEVILPINTSNLAEEILHNYDIQPRYCRIGQPSTIEAVKKVPNPLFSFEESSKFYYLKDGLLWTDGCLVALRILELLARKKKSFYDLVKLLPTYVTLTKKVIVKDDVMATIHFQLKKYFDNYTFSDEKERIEIDGFRINFNDYSWLLIRPSGTEPKIRIISDAKSFKRAEELVEQGKNIVETILKEL